MKELKIVRMTFLCVSSLLLFELTACSSDDDTKDEEMFETQKIAYDMIYGQWQEIYHYDGREGKNLTDGPIVSFVKDNTYYSSSDPDKAHSFKIIKIHKLTKDTLYCLAFHSDVDDSRRANNFQYQIEGDELHVKEEFFGDDFNKLAWKFRKCLKK